MGLVIDILGAERVVPSLREVLLSMLQDADLTVRADSYRAAAAWRKRTLHVVVHHVRYEAKCVGRRCNRRCPAVHDSPFPATRSSGYTSWILPRRMPFFSCGASLDHHLVELGSGKR